MEMEFTEAFELDVAPMSQTLSNMSDAYTSTNGSVMVRIAATHSGIVNSNLRRYDPDGMRRSVDSWTSDYQKPVLMHHDVETRDPIGRVIDAEYVDLTMGGAHAGNGPAGYIQLYAQISDPDAIQKINDGRYQTVSVGFSAKMVNCSVCGQDIGRDGMCDHIKGQSYEGKLCFWDINDLYYKECSFVNVPADKFAKVVGVDKDLIHKDAQETSIQFKDTAMINFLYDSHTQEVRNMPGMRIQFSDGIEFDQDDIAMIKTLDQQLDEEMGDAKLSGEQRKKLEASTFCGPDRSFPVPDCAHVTAARRLIGRYKGSGDKSKILACVARKAKSLGCKGASKNDAEELKALPDSAFAAVTGEGDNKQRIYPVDTAQHILNSIEELQEDYSLSSEDRKRIHTVLVTRGAGFGIKVSDWDPETQDAIEYTVLNLSEASLEEIFAVAQVKKHMEQYVKKEEASDGTPQDADEIAKKAFEAMKKEIADHEQKIKDLEDTVKQRDEEALQSAKENTKLLGQIHRDLAEKVVTRQYQLGKLKDVKSEDEFQQAIDSIVERDKASLGYALEDLEKEAPIFKWTQEPTQKVEPFAANDGGEVDDNNVGRHNQGNTKEDKKDAEDGTIGKLLGM